MKQQECDQSITPDTKLNTLLGAYPHLEDALVAMSPAFAKLRNPVLRKTVAKVATLRQVAQVGNIPLADLINKLRAEAGFTNDVYSDDSESAGQDRPAWFDASKVAKTLDARPILDAGEHPLGQVMSDIRGFEPGQIYELITPFLPAPLIDKIMAKGFDAWTAEEEPGVIRNYFRKQ